MTNHRHPAGQPILRPTGRQVRHWISIRFLAFVGLLSVCGLLAYHESDLIAGWARGKIAGLYLKHLAPQIPFEIEKIVTHATFGQMFRGDLPHMEVWLRKNEIRIRLSGTAKVIRLIDPTQQKTPSLPAPQSEKDVKKNEEEFRFQFAGQLKLENLNHNFEKLSSELPFNLEVHGAISKTLLKGVRFEANSQKWYWPSSGIETENLHFRLNWENPSDAEAQFSASSLTRTDGANAIHLANTKFLAQTPFKIQLPLQIGPEVRFDIQTQGAEILQDGLYLDLPLSELPLRGKLALGPQGLVLSTKIGKIAGKEAEIRMTLNSKYPGTLDVSGESVKLHWKIPPLPIAKLAPSLVEATQGSGGSLGGISKLGEMKFESGDISTQGDLSFVWVEGKPRSIQTDGNLNIRDLSLKWDSIRAAVKNLNLSFPFSNLIEKIGTLSFERGYFRHFVTHLAPTRLRFKPMRQKIAVRIGDQGKIPLTVDHTEFDLGELTGTITTADEKVGYLLYTSLNIQKLDLEHVARGLCLPSKKIPPGVIESHFPKIEIAPRWIDFTGDFHVQTLGGTIDVDDIGIFDLDTSVPELDFNLDFDNLRLDILSSWGGLGEMKGHLTGFAHDVTFQGWLPTRFVFNVDVQRRKTGKPVVFSPEAMKNFVTVIAGEDINHLPGIVDWYAFGLPRRLLGGYDMDYAGLTLISKDGLILLETHDPPGTDPKNHYLLSGKNFKMPLRSSHYPFIVDATAMSNYIHGLILRLSDLRKAQEKEKEQEAKKAGAVELKKDEEDETCALPPTL